MAKIQHVCLDKVVSYFDELEDPRSSVNLKHPLVSVVVIAMMAVLAGAGGPTAIAKWALSKEEFLLKVLSLPNGSCRCSSRVPFKPALLLGWDRCGPTPPKPQAWTNRFSPSMARPCGAVTIAPKAWALCIR